ncbi:mitochondrial fusion and transport protein ugo1 [Zygosaccharomyces mellis]|uniref:Mitochondrial fusion and transport protein ugo1 n=1 Tax=Zygosaccharomyces mellis TaxID=42258 RepID=A0A4C2E4F8_9SACH|nr:mitochondrial fusion and transport protein ugo1 [Zygosaccharomyces mellis]
MDDTGNRLQIRPYYDPNSFNAGYSSVFRPDEGVVDVNGHTLASKLNIAQGISRTASGGVLSEFSKGRKLLRNDSDSKVIDTLEWSDCLNVGIWKRMIGSLLDQFVRRYFRHLVQQPFEVVRCLLQVGEFDLLNNHSNNNNDKNRLPQPLELRNEEDQDEEIDFFPKTTDKQLEGVESSKDPPELDAEQVIHHHHGAEIKPESMHTMDIATAVMDNEGVRGLWKANNTTFIYNFLSLTLDAWFTGLISPFLDVPDPSFMDLIHSPDLKASILLTLSANLSTKMFLLPLDIIRTRLIVTSMQRTQDQRSLRRLTHQWSWRRDGFKIPGDMWVLTAFQSVTGVVFNKLFDLFIYHQFNVEEHSQIGWYHTLKLLSQTVELFVKLPLENLLRRCQVNYLLNTYRHPVQTEDLVVKPVPYKGIWSSLKNRSTNSGLWNGWRIVLMSIIGEYGFNILNIDSIDREQEKF